MGKYLEIAQKALAQTTSESIEDRCTTKDQQLKDDSNAKSQSTHCEISELSEISPVTDQELREVLEDDLDKVSNDPALLEAAIRRVTEAKQMESGVVPDAFTQTTDCKYCGPVYVPEGWPQPATNNCPWCMNRLKGLPIPETK